MACALQSLINRPQSTSPLVMEGTRKDWLPSKTLLHFQILSFAKITCSYFPHVLTKQCVGSARKKITACRGRSRATRPSGRRASGTPSWTSRTGRTRTTRGTATRACLDTKFTSQIPLCKKKIPITSKCRHMHGVQNGDEIKN
jgi:hypothetical protein